MVTRSLGITGNVDSGRGPSCFAQVNYDFDYDYDHAAYSQVKRNLGRLIDQGQLRLAMELSLELMKQGSYQAEMSDEGLMTERQPVHFGLVLPLRGMDGVVGVL